MTARRIDAVDQRITLVGLGQQSTNALRKLLEIVVERNDPVSVRPRNSADGGRMLSEVARQQDSAHARIRTCEALDQRPGSVPAAIVHENDFELDAALPEHLDDSPVQFRQCPGRPIYRNYYRDGDGRLRAIADRGCDCHWSASTRQL